MFRIHPKGTGVICTKSDGIPPHVVISEYLGELYPPYRWCEKLNVLEKAQKHFGLKPTLPDFYNILLERHRLDANGYGILPHVGLIACFHLLLKVFYSWMLLVKRTWEVHALIHAMLTVRHQLQCEMGKLQ
jgi:hypothetical protein